MVSQVGRKERDLILRSACREVVTRGLEDCAARIIRQNYNVTEGH